MHTFDEALDSSTKKSLNHSEFMMAYAVGGVFDYERLNSNSSSYVKFMGRVRNNTSNKDTFYPLHPCDASEVEKFTEFDNDDTAYRLHKLYKNTSLFCSH